MFTSLRGGMSELVEALEDHLTGDIRLGCRVRRVRYQNPGFEVTLAGSDVPPLRTDAVVLTTPAKVTATLLEDLDPILATQLDRIRYVSSATISLGYWAAEALPQHNLNGFGVVIPASEQRQIQACTWSSTKFNHRAPADKVLLRIFVGGDGQEHIVDWADEDLIALARRELAEIMGLTAEPIIRRIYRWPKGRPQYDVGHLERVAELEARATKFPGLYLAGSAFRGVGLPDCVKSALGVVDHLLTQFNSPSA